MEVYFLSSLACSAFADMGIRVAPRGSASRLLQSPSMARESRAHVGHTELSITTVLLIYFLANQMSLAHFFVSLLFKIQFLLDHFMKNIIFLNFCEVNKFDFLFFFLNILTISSLTCLLDLVV